MRSVDVIAGDVLKYVLSQKPQQRVVGTVTAKELLIVVVSAIGACPKSIQVGASP